MGCLPLLRKIDLLKPCPLKELLRFLMMVLKNKKKTDQRRYGLGLISKKKTVRELKMHLMFCE